MVAIIRIKRSTGVAAPGTLKTGELSYSAGTGTQLNLGDRLFYGKGDDGSGNATTVEVIGGAFFSNMLDHTAGTLTASSAIIVDASSKIDVINVNNLRLAVNTLSSTNTNGNVILDPNGTGTVDVSTSRITSVTDPTSPQDAATKAYVDAANTAQILNILGDAGTDAINLKDSNLSFLGDSWTTATVTNNKVTITHDTTGVTAAIYGASTSVPVLTVDNRGHIRLASTATIPDATTAVKGIASFATANFNVATGAVSTKDITLGTTALTNGSTTANVAGLTSMEVANVRLSTNVISSIGSNTLVLDPSPVGDSVGGYVGELIIRGNLTVQGITTTVNSTTVAIADKNIVLANGAANAAAADGAGITVNGPTVPATILYDGALDRWKVNKVFNLADSIGGNSLLFNGTTAVEAIQDYMATNFYKAGSGIDLTYNDAANTLTVTGKTATYLIQGDARFDSDQFTVTSGFVTIRVLDGGVY